MIDHVWRAKVLAQIGDPYRMGANPNQADPASFDCSSLCKWAYALVGIVLPRLAHDQRNALVRVADAPRAGDLVFLAAPASDPFRREIGHVAIVVDDAGTIVEAKGRAYGVVRSTVAEWERKPSYRGRYRHPAFKLDGTRPQPVSPGKSAPGFPLPDSHYFGPKSGPIQSVSGYYSHREDLRRWQARMRQRGWDLAADGLFGPQTWTVVKQFQAEKGLTVTGIIGPATWAAAWTAPIT